MEFRKLIKFHEMYLFHRIYEILEIKIILWLMNLWIMSLYNL